MRILTGTYALSAGYYDAYYKRAQQVVHNYGDYIFIYVMFSVINLWRDVMARSFIIVSCIIDIRECNFLTFMIPDIKCWFMALGIKEPRSLI